MQVLAERHRPGGYGLRDRPGGRIDHGQGLECGLQIPQGAGRHPAADPWLSHEAYEVGPEPSLEQGEGVGYAIVLAGSCLKYLKDATNAKFGKLGF